MTKNLVESYNELVPTMNQLLKEGFDIWEHHDNYCGYGFKVITSTKWVEVSICCNFTTPNVFYINCYERQGNCFDFLCNKNLGKRKTTNPQEVESLIKELL